MLPEFELDPEIDRTLRHHRRAQRNRSVLPDYESTQTTDTDTESETATQTMTNMDGENNGQNVEHDDLQGGENQQPPTPNNQQQYQQPFQQNKQQPFQNNHQP